MGDDGGEGRAVEGSSYTESEGTPTTVFLDPLRAGVYSLLGIPLFAGLRDADDRLRPSCQLLAVVS